MKLVVGNPLDMESGVFFNERTPLLDFKQKIITQSALMLYTECKAKFHLSINRRLEPNFRKKAFDFGDIWHDILGAHYTEMGNRQGGLRIKSEKQYTTVAAQLHKMMTSDSVNKDILNECFELYDIYVKTFPPEKEEERYLILGVECRFNETIPGTDWKMSAGMDVVMWDKKQKKVVIRDHKTTSSARDKHMPNPDLNYQGWDYTAVLSKNRGIHIGDIIFTATRKKSPTKPELLKSTMMPSTDRVPDTTYDIFVDAITTAQKEVRKPEHDYTKAALAGRKINFADYVPIIQELEKREDEEGNSFVWNKYAFVTEDRHRFFWEDARRKVLELEKETMWNRSFNSCNNHYGSCIYTIPCMMGLKPENLRGFSERSTYLNSIVSGGEVEN